MADGCYLAAPPTYALERNRAFSEIQFERSQGTYAEGTAAREHGGQTWTGRALSQQIQLNQPSSDSPAIDRNGGPVSGGSVRHDHPDEYRGRCAENDVLYEPLFAAFAGHDVMLYAFALCGEAG